jgi:hypothetical protein
MLDIGEITLRGAHDHGDLTPSRGSSSAILGSLWGTFSAGGGRPEETMGRLGCSGPPPHHQPPQGPPQVGEEAGKLPHRAASHLGTERRAPRSSSTPPVTLGGRVERGAPPTRSQSHGDRDRSADRAGLPNRRRSAGGWGDWRRRERRMLRIFWRGAIRWGLWRTT